MKLTTCLLPLSLASFAAAGFFGGQEVLADSADLDVPGDNPLAFCSASDKDNILVIDYVDLEPNPPQAGKVLTIKASGNFTQQVDEGAYIYLQVKYGLIRLINTKTDLCEQMKNVDKECPLEKGETIITKNVTLPDKIPSGTYQVSADAYTKDDEKIICLEATVKFGS